MPSPFPGMNPYLENEHDWSDFHVRLLPYLGSAIQRLLPRPYHTRVDRNVYIHELSADERRLLGRPDVLLTTRDRPTPSSLVQTLTAPVFGGVPEAVDIVRVPFLEIRDSRDERVVTTLEVLSPSNKDGSSDAEQYRRKVLNILRTNTNFVEIDLLRGGKRTKWIGVPPCDYCISVSQASERPKAAFWPFGVRDTIPPLVLPLGEGLPPVIVDLKPVIEEVYDSAGYGDYIYDQSPMPPLNPADAAWAAEILAAVKP